MIDRPKEGFVLPTYDWLQDEMKDYVFDKLSKESLNRYGLINAAYVGDLLRAYYENPSANSRHPQIIWNLLSFQNWCDLYL